MTAPTSAQSFYQFHGVYQVQGRRHHGTLLAVGLSTSLASQSEIALLDTTAIRGRILGAPYYVGGRISLVSGKAVAAASRTTIDGIEIATATNVAVLRATTTTIGTTDIADARDERRMLPAERQSSLACACHLQ
jgi:hypothetical protein